MIRPGRFLIMAIGVIICMAAVSARAADEAARSAPPDAAMIITRAAAAAKAGDLSHAIELYSSVSRLFPNDEKVPEALWQAAELSRLEAGKGKADWQDVRGMYRDFVVAAPGSPRIVAAYLEIARINLRLRLYPEARSYLRLIVKKYPNSALMDEAWLMTARVEMAMGRLGVAEEHARKVFKSRSQEKRLRATMLLAEILSDRGRLSRAVSLIRRIEPKLAKGSAEYAEAIRIKGRSQLLMADPVSLRKGRENLFYYLNIIDDRDAALETSLLLAEGFLKEKNYPAAKSLLTRVEKGVDHDSLSGLRARFLLAMIRDLGLAGPPPSGKNKSWQSGGDEVFHQIIRRIGRRDEVQLARYVLMRRLLVRGDDDGAYVQGRAYLLDGGGEWRNRVLADAEAILERRYTALLGKQDNPRVYEDYRKEYPVIRMFDKGKILYLVGRALENMGLYDQASVVYYRALGKKLDDKVRDDLYVHRARTYLAAADLESADRLLKYLRGRYKKGPAAAEIRYLSGRLLVLQDRADEAMAMLDAAFKMPAGADTMAGLIREAGPMLIRLNRLDQLSRQLRRCAKIKCLAPEELQGNYVLLGDALRRHGRDVDAVSAYRRAVAVGPAESAGGQKAAFYLGRGVGGTDGEKILAKVAQGDTPFWPDLAGSEAADIRIKKLAAETGTRP